MKYLKTWAGVTSGSHLGRDDGYPEQKSINHDLVIQYKYEQNISDDFIANNPASHFLHSDGFSMKLDSITEISKDQAETILKEDAVVPPKLTAVAPEKFVPVIVTVAPVAALVGVKEVMVGL